MKLTLYLPNSVPSTLDLPPLSSVFCLKQAIQAAFCMPAPIQVIRTPKKLYIDEEELCEHSGPLLVQINLSSQFLIQYQVSLGPEDCFSIVVLVSDTFGWVKKLIKEVRGMAEDWQRLTLEGREWGDIQTISEAYVPGKHEMQVSFRQESVLKATALSPMPISSEFHFAYIVTYSGDKRVVYFHQSDSLQSLISKVCDLFSLSPEQFILVHNSRKLNLHLCPTCANISEATEIALYTVSDQVVAVTLLWDGTTHCVAIPRSSPLSEVISALSLSIDSVILMCDGQITDGNRTIASCGISVQTRIEVYMAYESLYRIERFAGTSRITDTVAANVGNMKDRIQQWFGVPVDEQHLLTKDGEWHETELPDNTSILLLTPSEIRVKAVLLEPFTVVEVMLSKDELFATLKSQIASKLAIDKSTFRLMHGNAVLQDDFKALSECNLPLDCEMQILRYKEIVITAVSSHDVSSIVVKLTDTVYHLDITLWRPATIKHWKELKVIHEGRVLHSWNSLADCGIVGDTTVEVLLRDEERVICHCLDGGHFIVTLRTSQFSFAALTAAVERITGVAAENQSFSWVGELIDKFEVSAYRVQSYSLIRFTYAYVSDDYTRQQLSAKGIVRITLPQGNSISLSFGNYSSILLLKKKISQRSEVPERLQALHFGDIPLSNDVELTDLGSNFDLTLTIEETYVVVQGLDGSHYYITLELTETGASLKEKVRQQTRLLPGLQMLHYAGAILDEDRSLESSGIASGATIYLSSPQYIPIYVQPPLSPPELVYVRKGEYISELKAKISRLFDLSADRLRLIGSLSSVNSSNLALVRSELRIIDLTLSLNLQKNESVVLLRVKEKETVPLRINREETIAKWREKAEFAVAMMGIRLTHEGKELQDSSTAANSGLGMLSIIDFCPPNDSHFG